MRAPCFVRPVAARRRRARSRRSQPVFAVVARASASGGEGASTALVAAARRTAREMARGVGVASRGAGGAGGGGGARGCRARHRAWRRGRQLMEARYGHRSRRRSLAGRLRADSRSRRVGGFGSRRRASSAHDLEELGATAAEAWVVSCGGAPASAGPRFVVGVVGRRMLRRGGQGASVADGASWSLACSGGDAVVGGAVGAVVARARRSTWRR